MAPRVSLTLGALAAVALAAAQNPDVAVFADLHPTFMRESSERTVYRWFDAQGRPSVVGFRLLLEDGKRVLVAQRLTSYGGTSDADLLDEYYLEDPGAWRIGKQYLPFGRGQILRDTAPGGRIDTTLLLDEVPLRLAVVDAGPGRPRGIVGRVGRVAGVSFALGDHFGIQGSSLTPFRHPSQNAGRGRGWGQALGFDFDIAVGSMRLQVEGARLMRGATPDDPRSDLSDFRASFPLPQQLPGTWTMGWARNWTTGLNVWRWELDYLVDQKLSWRPYVRYSDGKVQEFGVSARIRL